MVLTRSEALNVNVGGGVDGLMAAIASHGNLIVIPVIDGMNIKKRWDSYFTFLFLVGDKFLQNWKHSEKHGIMCRGRN